MEDKELIEKVMEKFGEDNQIIQFFEELNELGSAVNHYRRGKIDKQFLVNEMADVKFMLKQIKQMYNITEEEIEESYEYTKKRLEYKLEDVSYK